MEYIPAKLVIKDYVQYTYKCTECGKNDEYPEDVICSAPLPAPVLKHSVASPSIVAWIMYQKYQLSVPLYRQERDFRRMGAALKRDTMANWGYPLCGGLVETPVRPDASTACKTQYSHE